MTIATSLRPRNLRPRVERICFRWAIPSLLAGGFSWLCYTTAGATLGLFIGGLAAVVLVVPFAVLAQENWRGRLEALAASVLGTAVVWQFSVLRGPLIESESMRCVLILLSFAIALAGVALLFRAMRLPAACASALTAALALAWLSWPVWMANFQHGEDHQAQVAHLMVPHPIFTLNQALQRPLPDKWHEARIMYGVVSIGQHVSATFPESIWPCVLLHLLLGSACAGIARGLRL